MKANQKINLPELKNPISSNFKDESFTGGPACLAAIVLSAVIYVIK